MLTVVYSRRRWLNRHRNPRPRSRSHSREIDMLKSKMLISAGNTRCQQLNPFGRGGAQLPVDLSGSDHQSELELELELPLTLQQSCTRHIQLQAFSVRLPADSNSTRTRTRTQSCEINVRSDLHRPHPKGLSPGGYDMLIRKNKAQTAGYTARKCNIFQGIARDFYKYFLYY